MIILRLFVTVFFVCGAVLPPQPSVAQETHSSTMSMMVGDVQTFPTKELARVSITHPDIADISDATAEQVVVVGKKIGQTVLFYWDSKGKHTVAINVSVQDLKILRDRIKRLLDEADIGGLNVDANEGEGKVVISGDVPKEKKIRFEKLIDPYFDQTINLTKEQICEDLVQIDMQITELSETLDRNLGVTWSGATNESPLFLTYEESPFTANGAKDWLKLGKFNRQNLIINTVHLLEKEGKARNLSNPRILVTCGKQATINVGGEVPIESTTVNATGGVAQTNVTFKQYGITVVVTPTIKDNDKINVLMNLQISDVDTSFPVQASRTSDVAYKTRNAQTELMLTDQQTIVMAGLVRYGNSFDQRRVPFFGRLPIVGIFFRNTSKQIPDEAKELVITLTPTIVRKKDYARDQINMPTKKAEANRVDMERQNDWDRGSLPTDRPKNPPPPKPAPKKISSHAEKMPMGKDSGMDATKMSAKAGKGAAAKTTVASGNVTPYVRGIQVKISKAITYPFDALKNKWQGTVKLRLHILKDGSLAEAKVVQSSGHKVFDKDALNTAKIVAPFAAFPKDMKGDYVNITIPIVYNQPGNKPKTQAVVTAY